jgi:hypothetical protein
LKVGCDILHYTLDMLLTRLTLLRITTILHREVFSKKWNSLLQPAE